MYMRKLLLINLLLMSVLLMQAQTYCGLHKYDGEHKNEASGYMMGGSNVVSDAFFGFEGSYQRHLTDRWHVGGDMQIQFGKQLYSVDVKGGYRLPVSWMDFYFDGQFMYNRYNRWDANETIANISITWESLPLRLPVRRRSSCLISSSSGKPTLFSAAMCISGMNRKLEAFIT